MYNNELEEVLVNARRCTKVTKGGRTFSFSVVVVVGNKKGNIGYGLGKALEVIDAKQKAVKQAKTNMFKIQLKEGRTIHHDVVGKFSSSLVKIRSAPSGKGVIAGGAMRHVFKALGIQDVVAKSLGSNNPHNLVKATINGLLKAQSPKLIFERRGGGINSIVRKRY
jgi:small subunit ribosomal protein S5